MWACMHGLTQQKTQQMIKEEKFKRDDYLHRTAPICIWIDCPPSPTASLVSWLLLLLLLHLETNQQQGPEETRAGRDSVVVQSERETEYTYASPSITNLEIRGNKSRKSTTIEKEYDNPATNVSTNELSFFLFFFCFC